jgi:hypothetical protein
MNFEHCMPVLLPTLCAAALSEPLAAAAPEPPRRRRADCFFGVHFDFHAELYDRELGRNTTVPMVTAILDTLQPDYIEVDTKGHPGVSSYPTQVGNHGGSFVGDPLRVWRDVTARRGIPLYGHYSGLWDIQAMKLHPEWTRVLADGTPDAQNASVFGPYVDQVLIPQLVELAVDYRLDGIWVDGDVWRASVDYCEQSQTAFRQQTGREAVPTAPADPGWHEWREFHRQSFRRYVGRYIEQVTKAAPGFEICCNWAFSTHMPEAVCLPVGFTSGDICGLNSVDGARFESRVFAAQGVPWDLMSWSFNTWNLGTLDPPESRKPAIQLMREAACVIAQGGGYQAVFSQAGPGNVRDGSVDLEKIKLFADVARFCRERQEVCFKATPVPQVAVCVSTAGTYRRWDSGGRGLFWWDRWQYGAAISILENQVPVEVVLADRLARRLDDYPLVVVSDWEFLEPAFVAVVPEYVRKGGRLLLVGSGPAAIFREVLESAAAVVVAAAPPAYSLRYYQVGLGTIALVGKPPDTTYYGTPSPELRDFTAAILAELLPEPIVRVRGSHDVDVSLLRTTKGELAVHLVNTSGPHRTAAIIGTIDPVGPLEITIRSRQKPTRVERVPGYRPIPHEYKEGTIRLTLDAVALHDIVLVD